MELSAQLIATRNESQKALEEALKLISVSPVLRKTAIAVSVVTLLLRDELRQGIPEHDWILSDSEQTALYRRLWTTIKSGGSKTRVDLVATVAVIKNEHNATQYVGSGLQLRTRT